MASLPAFNEDTTDKPSRVRREPIGAKRVQQLREDFRDRIRMVQSVDDMVGRVLSTLTDAEKRSTYVVFASDNGFHLGQHRLVRGKSTAYDHDVRVPLLVKRPATGRQDRVVTNAIAQNVDLFETFLDMAGIDADSRDGRSSLLPLIQGQKVTDWRDAALIEHVQAELRATARPDADRLKTGNAQPPSYNAVRTAGALYVEYEGDPKPEYYNTVTDPHQQSNQPGNARKAALSKGARCSDGVRQTRRGGLLDGRSPALNQSHSHRAMAAATATMIDAPMRTFPGRHFSSGAVIRSSPALILPATDVPARPNSRTAPPVSAYSKVEAVPGALWATIASRKVCGRAGGPCGPDRLGLCSERRSQRS
ncbi:sulfatase-like hydrolase/transferase [Nonomuraea sp. NPDC002799]